MDHKNLLNHYDNDNLSSNQSMSIGGSQRVSQANRIMNLKNLTQGITKLGGIGAANVGSKDWEEKMYLLKKRKDYGNQN